MKTKLDRATKKAVNQVIKKYADKWKERQAPVFFMSVGALGLTLAAVDLVTTGGLVTMTLESLAYASAFALAGVMTLGLGAREHTNDAGQKYRSGEFVSKALTGMQNSLRAAFTAAMKPDADERDKAKLKWVIEDVQADVKTLSPAFRMVAGGPNGFSAEKFEFIVAERVTGEGRKELVSLDKMLQEMNAAAQKPAEPETSSLPELRKPPKPDTGFRL